MLFTVVIIETILVFMAETPVLDDPDDVVVDIADLHVLPHGSLDVLDHLDSSHGIHQARHLAVLDTIHSPDSSDTVNIVGRIQREVVVYHMTVY